MIAVLIFLRSYAITPPSFHLSREEELRATFGAFLETGVPLIKSKGSGSWYTHLPEAPRQYEPSAWDDDPGAYLVASYVGRAGGFVDPYEPLHLVMAFLAALPWLVLPLAMARLFGRVSAGLMVLLAPLAGLLLRGNLLLGNDYGQTGKGTGSIYATYGIPSAWLFLWLSLLLLIATVPFRWWRTVVLILVVGAAAGLGNLLRSWTGLGIAIALGVLLALNIERRRLLTGAAVGMVTFTVSLSVQWLTIGVINNQRATFTGVPAAEVPEGHPIWHTLYLGLGYQGALDGYATPNPFGIEWSDTFAWEKAREMKPDVVLFSAEYESILRRLYLEEVGKHGWLVTGTYFVKLADTLIQNAWSLLFIGATAVGLAAFRQHPKGFTVGLGIAAPLMVVGVLPPVLAMPLKYYFVELTPALGVLVIVTTSSCSYLISGIKERLTDESPA